MGFIRELSNLPRKEIGTRFIVMTMTIGACFIWRKRLRCFASSITERCLVRSIDKIHWPAQAESSTGNSFGCISRYYHFEADYQGNLGRALCFSPGPLATGHRSI